MPASSQASSELPTASLTAVRRAFLGLSKPSRCLFLAKNSLTEMSRCFAAIDSAVTAPRLGPLPVSLRFGIFAYYFILPRPLRLIGGQWEVAFRRLRGRREAVGDDWPRW